VGSVVRALESEGELSTDSADGELAEGVELRIVLGELATSRVSREPTCMG
jgi:hypothetical protein